MSIEEMSSESQDVKSVYKKGNLLPTSKPRIQIWFVPALAYEKHGGVFHLSVRSSLVNNVVKLQAMSAQTQAKSIMLF